MCHMTELGMPAAATIVVDAAMLAASLVKHVRKTATVMSTLVLPSDMVAQPSNANVIHTSCC